MARKSAAAKSVTPVLQRPVKLPDPPRHLTASQADIWRMVVASRAGDLIAPEAYPVLVEYCRAVTASNLLAAEIDQFDPEWSREDDGLRRWDKLLGMQDRLAAKICSLATKLRLTPQSRVHRETAGTHAAKGKGGKPWQLENDD